MTEIKRSFYLLMAFTAILVFIPLFNATKVMDVKEIKHNMPYSMLSSVVVAANEMSVGDAARELEGTYEVVSSDILQPSPLTNSDILCDPLTNEAWSTTYRIAVTDGVPVSITNVQRDMIAAVLQLEVLGKYSRADQFENPDLKYYELLAVAQIIRNRLMSDCFPDDIKTIIYDSHMTSSGKVYQFSTSPYINGTTPTELAYAAVDEVFTNGVSVLPDDYYYFCATWRESRFEINNRAVLRFLGDVGEYDKIVADATTFYAGVTMRENIANGYVF